MRNISVMIKPASSLCNLRCRYCFYAEVSERRDCRSYGLMRRETAERIIENNFRDLERGDSVTLAFQGGEPTLAGLDFFRFFAERVDAVRDGVRVSWALQTNGTLLDGDWCAFLKEKDFLVGLSLDAMQDSHDENRVDAEGKGTYARVSAARALPEKHGVAYNVLTVLTEALALCASCPYAAVCGGGCPRMRSEVCGDPEAKSCGYRAFLDACLPQIQLVARRERMARAQQVLA